MIDLTQFFAGLPRKPRDFQKEAVSSTVNFLAEGERKRALIVAPTGSGKGDMAAQIAAYYASQGKRTLIVTPRKQLVMQLHDRCGVYGVDSAVEMATKHAIGSNAPVIVASAQTLVGDRLRSWPRDAFDVVVVDECHHLPSASGQATVAHFRAGLVGLTATPYRADGESISECFDKKTFVMRLHEAVDLGLICPFQILKSNVQIDLRALRVEHGDFAVGELAKVVEAAVTLIAEAVRKGIGGRKAILFTPRILSAELMSEELERIGVAACSLHGGMSRKDKAKVLAKYEAGEYRVLCNSMLLTEGFDSPSTDMIILARPTKSTGLLAQMIGRAARLYPGKTDALVMDFSWMTDRHHVARVEDVIKPTNEHWAEFEQIRSDEDFEFGGGGFSTYEEARRAAILEAGQQILGLGPDAIRFLRNNLQSITAPITVDAILTGWTPRISKTGRPFSLLMFDVVGENYSGKASLPVMLDGGAGNYYAERAANALGVGLDYFKEQQSLELPCEIEVTRNGEWINATKIVNVFWSATSQGSPKISKNNRKPPLLPQTPQVKY